MIGAFILISMRFRIIKENLKAIDLFMIIGLLIFVVLELVYDIHQVIILGLGREQTLTGRIDFWKELIPMTTNPWIGTGYESFWLGDRAEIFWRRYYWHPNQAHNGYLETYLNLGWIGVLLLTGVLFSCYRSVRRTLIDDFDNGIFQMAYLVVVLLYNLTEFGFKGLHPIWFVFLLFFVKVYPTSNHPASRRTEPL